MKERLSKIRDMLKYQENMAINGMASHRDCILGSCATALTLLDSILAELDSPELRHKVSGAIYAPDESCPITRGMYLSYEDAETCERADKQAQAAINAIKGK